MARNLGHPFNRMPEDRDKEFRELEERLAQQKNQEPEINWENISTNNHFVYDSKDFWRIPHITHRGKIYTADLSKSLLDNGSLKNQQEWVEFRKIAEPRGEFYTGDMPTQYAIFNALAHSNGYEAREFIKKQMRKRWLMTLTRVVYNTHGKDDIFHNWGLNDEYELHTNLVGPDQFIKENKDTSYLEALLGTKDVQKINEVFHAINGTDTYILRINSKQKTQPFASAAGFSANSGQSYLYCSSDPSNDDPSLGIRLIENKTNGGQNK